jgi:hypothetical protein
MEFVWPSFHLLSLLTQSTRSEWFSRKLLPNKQNLSLSSLKSWISWNSVILNKKPKSKSSNTLIIFTKKKTVTRSLDFKFLKPYPETLKKRFIEKITAMFFFKTTSLPIISVKSLLKVLRWGWKNNFSDQERSFFKKKEATAPSTWFDQVKSNFFCLKTMTNKKLSASII